MTKQIFVLLLIASLTFTSAFGQDLNIDGGKIYVSDDGSQVTLFFGSKITNVVITPEKSRKDFSTRIINEKAFEIEAKTSKVENAILIIEEGKQRHRFQFVYKPDLDNADLEHRLENAKQIAEFKSSYQGNKVAQNNASNKSITVSEPAGSKPMNDNKAPQSLYDKAQQADKEGNIQQAIAYMEEAVKISPSNQQIVSFLNTLNLKKQAIALKTELDRKEKLNTIIVQGDEARRTKNFGLAKEKYNQALALVKDDPKNTELIEKKIKEISGLELIDQANKAFANKDYEKAKALYTQSQNFISDNGAIAQIKESDKRLSTIAQEQEALRKREEVELKYRSIIASADNAYNLGDLRSAKGIYEEAKQLMPEKQRPKDLLQKINQTITAYELAIQKADNALERKDFTNAKAQYTIASGLLKLEAYPKERLLIIGDVQAKYIADAEAREKAEKIAKEYTNLITKGDNFLKQSDFEKAKQSYLDASNLKPDNTEAKQKLTEAIQKEKMQAKLKEKTQLFNNAEQFYREAVTSKNLDISNDKLRLARVTYLQAIEGADGVEFDIDPKFRIHFIDSTLEKRQQDYEISLYQKIMIEYASAKKDGKSDEELISILKEALKHKPNDPDAMDWISRHQLRITKNYNNTIITTSQPQSKVEAQVLQTANKSPEAPKEADRLQQSWLPYTLMEIKNKYPTIDFDSPPADQRFNQTGSTNNNIVNEFKEEAEQFKIKAESNNVKLICQGLKVVGTDLYMKFLIQNDSKADFLVGPMMLKWQRSLGSAASLKPNMGLRFPIIKPGKDFVIVYVTKAPSALADDHNLSFELKDRDKLNTLSLTIDGKMFNKYVKYSE